MRERLKRAVVPGTRWRRLGLAGSILLLLPAAAALQGCAEGSYAADNRHPDMRHGNFEDPGSRAADNQGHAGRD